MIRYYCNTCNNEWHFSECKVCKNKEIKNAKLQKRKINEKNYRAIAKSQIYWCDKCNIPLYDSKCSICGSICKEISTDLRPVFPEERLLLEVLLGEPFKFVKDSVWNGKGNRYIVNGEKLNVKLEDLRSNNPIEVKSEIIKLKSKNTYKYFNEYIKKFIKANMKRLNYIKFEAQQFIKNISKGYNLGEMFISFSGGKDSTVVRDLVIRALSKPEIIHIFGNTTLEFPFTLEYINRLKKQNARSPILIAKNRDKDFMDMNKKLGPPSRVMRWCCTIFKTGAITRKLEGVFKNKTKILTFYGIRRSESSSRSKYNRVSISPKITKQKVASPIIDWYDFDIWLYILGMNIDFNYAYRLGYSRVGCWCCPNNSDWSQYLSSIYMTDKYLKWREFLIKFAKKIGKKDAEEYIDSGNWKARQGGDGLELSKNRFISFKPCAIQENTFNYELKKDITNDFYELFKPFGFLNYQMGNKRLGEVYVVDKNNVPLIRLQGRKGNSLLKISILKYPLLGTRSLRDTKLKIECQITKYQMCLGCLACESVCKQDAISIQQINGKISYRIDDKKCIRCGKCVNHFDGGCYMRKILMTKKGTVI